MSFIVSHDLNALKKKVEAGQGKIKFRLNDTDVELIYGEDFFYNAFERAKKDESSKKWWLIFANIFMRWNLKLNKYD